MDRAERRSALVMAISWAALAVALTLARSSGQQPGGHLVTGFVLAGFVIIAVLSTVMWLLISFTGWRP